MKSYRYTLQPYHGPASRYHCPQCRDKRKTFVRYINTQTGEQLADHVGRCSRQDKCAYHLTPKQFFEDDVPFIKSGKQRESTVFKKPAFTSYIPAAEWKSTLRNYNNNNFVLYLRKFFGYQKADEMIQRYHIGTSKKWSGATIFWQVDENGNCRTGKIMLYDKDTGKRVKQPYNHISWVHTLRDKIQRPLYPDFTLRQCLFGAHLLKERQKTVRLVESEKTAIILAVYYPDDICIAAGGKEGLTKDKCAIIRYRHVLLIPDEGGYDNWEAKAKEYLSLHSIQPPPKDSNDGEDIADWLMER
jgi:hypothetical protein